MDRRIKLFETERTIGSELDFTSSFQYTALEWDGFQLSYLYPLAQSDFFWQIQISDLDF